MRAGLSSAGGTDQGCSPCASSARSLPLFFHAPYASWLPSYKSWGRGLGVPRRPLREGRSSWNPYTGMLDLGAGKKRARCPSRPWELASPLPGGCGKVLLRAGACRISGGGSTRWCKEASGLAEGSARRFEVPPADSSLRHLNVKKNQGHEISQLTRLSDACVQPCFCTLTYPVMLRCTLRIELFIPAPTFNDSVRPLGLDSESF